jgi:hypothetical protein
MLHIDLYNRKFDYTFLSKSELIHFQKQNNNVFFTWYTTEETIIEYEIDNFSVKHYFTKDLPIANKNSLLVYYFADGALSLIGKLFDEYSNKMEYTIVIVAVSYAEAYIFSSNYEIEKEYKQLFINAKNFHLIHFEPYFEQERCYFLKKIALQNLLNFVPSVGVFHYMKPHFKSIKKDKRIGFHLNKINNWSRYTIFDILVEHFSNKKDKLFITLNKSKINPNLDIIQDLINKFGDKIFDEYQNFNYAIHTYEEFYNEDWYLPNLFDYSLKSDIELVYETNAWEEDYKKHFTEKTLKHLMLGKPFIHIEPVMYQIMEKYGFKNYDCLYDENLIKLYKELSFFGEGNTNPEKYKESNFKEYFIDTIKRLIDMPENKWNDLMIQCEQIAEYNYNLITEVLFEENIREILKTIKNE